MPAKPSISKIEIAELSLKQVLATDITDADRAILEAAMTSLTGMRPNVNAADHMPIFTTAKNGDQRVTGCTCGDRPAKRPQRSSMMMSPFNSHLAKVGVPRTEQNQYPRYTEGPKAGMTMNEAYEAGLGF